MLLTKIKSAAQLIEDVSVAETKARAVKNLENFGKRLKTQLPKVEPFSQALSALHAHDPLSFPKQDMQFALDKLDELELELEKESPKEKALLELGKDVHDREELLKQAWFRYAEKASEELLQLLGSLQGIVGQDADIKQFVQSLNLLRTRWPINEKNVVHFAEQLDKGKQKLEVLNVGSNVRSFLEKLTKRQATLDDLTDDVLQWLKDQNFTRRLSIGFSEATR